MFAEMMKRAALATLVAAVVLWGTAAQYQLLLNLTVCLAAVMAGRHTLRANAYRVEGPMLAHTLAQTRSNQVLKPNKSSCCP